ncbi:unnamed protein product [Bursaphelenchus okinawaensis]|uniref:Transthyretin-like protein 5 n=1 Tax=Bursaphelenchus okinawaensis TaxID=465554 RepID=A0A811JRM5_9BILA|nr:unnamed protein product [Bursaphelenchus okinawaensis]CAG9079416.1 unnamed protein product [Bursaphelenchus okinawaensis]
MKIIIILSVTLAVATAGLIGSSQSSGAKGKLTCHGKPLSDVLIKLYDDDRGLDADDFMGKTTSDKDGYFELQGYSDEISSIDPKINIYHDCDDGWTPCQRKISIMIPDRYITKGKVAQQLYDAGTMELSGKFPGETRDCIH